MTTETELVVGANGVARCIDDGALDLREIGKLQITRASQPRRAGCRGQLVGGYGAVRWAGAGALWQ